MAPTFHYVDNSHYTTFESDYNNTNSVELYYKFYGPYTTDHTFTVEKLTGYKYFDDVSIPHPDHEFVFYNRTHSNGTSTFTDTYNDSIVATASGNASIQDKYALKFQGGYLDVTPWTIGSAFTMEFVASYHSWTAFSKIIDFGNITFGDARVFDSGGNTDTPNEVGGSFKLIATYSSSYYFRTCLLYTSDAADDC